MPRMIRITGVLVLAVVVGLLGCDNSTTPGGNVPGPDAGSADGREQAVALVIEFEDNTTRRFDAIAWSSGMTVQSVMDEAKDGEGQLAYRHTGRGETAILHAIDGVENQGAGRAANNWLYWVNGQFATRGFGVTAVEPGDTVTWRFAPYDAAE